MGTCSHLLFMIMGRISGEHLRKFRETLFWPWTSNFYLTGKKQEKKKKILSLMLMQYTCLKYFLKGHKIVSSQVEFWCTLKGKV